MNDGVQRYVKMSCKVANFFPVDHRGVTYMSCQYCNFYRKSSNRCSITHEIIFKPENYMGNSCPLVMEEEEHDI